MTGVAAAAMVMAAGQAWAQGADTGAELAEVVVTATKIEGTVNSVPLSISAVTTRQLDQQGIKTVTDLARVVPGLSVSAPSPAVGNFTIRGLYSNAGAATTGVYLNDIPLQRRNTTSAFQINGSPAPPLFDLERVEVLRGPQGTLYGGSSLGGTIRFITPAPSLTRYSAYARGEVSATDYSGGTNYEAGLAVGGPIIKDKLGFRASAYTRKDAGYVDLVSPFDGGGLRFKDANWTKVWAFQSSFKGALTDNLSATLFLYTSGTKVGNGNATYNLPIDPAYTTTGGLVTLRPPFGSLGPFSYLDKPFQSFSRTPAPQSTRLTTPALTIDWEGPGFNVQSITAYIEDESRGWNGTDTAIIAAFTGVVSAPGGVAGTTGVPYNPLLRDGPGFLTETNRYGLSEELRFSTTGDGPFKLVAGVYASKFRTRSQNYEYGDVAIWGLPSEPRIQAPGPLGVGYIIAGQTQNIKERELAAFGELSYQITPKLSALVGLRVSDMKLSYDSGIIGRLFGGIQPTVANGYLSSGVQKNTPVTPKFGLQYKLADDKLLYANMAKGFRAGGVNVIPVPVLCSPGLALLGLTVDDVPKAYGPDSVWNHEVGAKMRVLPGVQVNASAFLINWNDVQFNASISRCGQTPTVNAGTARSQGFDLQADARLFEGLTASLAVGYTHGEYTETAYALIPKNGSAPVPSVVKGDKLPVAPWTFSASLNYEFPLRSSMRGFVRADYQYSSSYKRSFGPAASGYLPDSRDAEATDVVNVRAGVRTGKIELNAFVNNLFNSRDLLSEGGAAGQHGRTGCTNTACTSYLNYNPFFTGSTFRPRTIGAQATYRY